MGSSPRGHPIEFTVGCLHVGCFRLLRHSLHLRPRVPPPKLAARRFNLLAYPIRREKPGESGQVALLLFSPMFVKHAKRDREAAEATGRVPRMPLQSKERLRLPFRLGCTALDHTLLKGNSEGTKRYRRRCGRKCLILQGGRVAQLVEQCPFKAWVAGSNPAALTKIFLSVPER